MKENQETPVFESLCPSCRQPTGLLCNVDNNSSIRQLIENHSEPEQTTGDIHITSKERICSACIMLLNARKDVSCMTKQKNTDLVKASIPNRAYSTPFFMESTDETLSNYNSPNNSLLVPLYHKSENAIDTESGGNAGQWPIHSLTRQKRHRQEAVAQKCPYCPKKYKRDHFMRKHLRTHSHQTRSKEPSTRNRSLSTASAFVDKTKAQPSPNQNQSRVCLNCGVLVARLDEFHMIICNKMKVDNDKSSKRRRTRSQGLDTAPNFNTASVLKTALQLAVTHRDEKASISSTAENMVQLYQNGHFAGADWHEIPEFFHCSTNGCLRYFNALSKCEMHEYRFHKSQLSYNCGECGDWFITRNNLNLHQLGHNRNQMTCSSCDLIFPSKYKLVEHIKNSEHPFVCIFCHKSYMLNSHLVWHTISKHRGKEAIENNHEKARTIDRYRYKLLTTKEESVGLKKKQYAAHVRIQRSCARLPRTIRLPMIARYPTNGLMRGLRKSGMHLWDGIRSATDSI